MNPNQPTGPVMDVQRPRPGAMPPDAATAMGSPMPPADSIAGGDQKPEGVYEPGKIKPKRTGLIIAIVTIVAVLVIGFGVGGFILYKNQNKPAPAVTETESDNERVNVEEIDATVTEIDKTLNTLNDSGDVTPNDVSDSNLGL